MKRTHFTPVILCSMALAAVALTATAALAGSHPRNFDDGMQPILHRYLGIHNALAGDSTDGVQTAAESIATTAAALAAAHGSGQQAADHKNLAAALQQAAESLSKAADIDAARQAFKKLSEPMSTWAATARPEGVQVLYCSMAEGRWLQENGKVRNPYYGASMSACGEVVAGAAPAGKPTNAAPHHH